MMDKRKNTETAGENQIRNDLETSTPSLTASMQVLKSNKVVDEIIDEVTDRLVRGEPVDIDEYVRRLPSQAIRLQRILSALVALHPWGGPNNDFPIEPHPSRSPHGIGSLGEFTIMRELGRGGMGIVYEALQLSLERRVALKILPMASMFDERRLKRFKNEARAAAMLKHPNIVSVHSVGCERNLHFYAMELIQGESLAVLTQNQNRSDSQLRNDNENDLPRNNPTGDVANVAGDSAAGDSAADTEPIAALTTSYLNEGKSFHRSIARLGIQAAGALGYAHQEGVIHRDIKPSNLMIDQQGQLHITDFGLARIIQSTEDITLSGDIIGTLRYMSPEQIDGRQVADQRTDIYSLGLTLYELLAGRPAYVATTRSELLSQIVDTEPARLANYGVATDLATVVRKSIAKDPADRYLTASELGDDLNRFLNNEPVRARPTSKIQRFIRWCRRNRAAGALLGLVGLILLTLAVGGPIAAIQQAKLAEQRRVEVYAGDMAQANRHVSAGEIDLAVVLLRQYLPNPGADQPDLRHFEWYEILERCQRRLDAVTTDQGWPTYGGEWSPDGKYVASARYFDGPILIDASTGRIKWAPKESEHAMVSPRDLEFTPDGAFILSTYGSDKVYVWDASDGTLASRVQVPDRTWSIAISKPGIVALGISGLDADEMPGMEPGSVQLYRLSDFLSSTEPQSIGELIGLIGTVHNVEFNNDGSRVGATSHDGKVYVWNTSTQELEFAFQVGSGVAKDLSFSADGRLVCGCGGDYDGQWHLGRAVMYDLDSQSKVFEVSGGVCMTSVDFSGDTGFVTGDMEGRLRVFDCENPSPVEAINAHAYDIRHVRVSPNGQFVASMGQDNATRIWELSASYHKSRYGQDARLKNFNDLKHAYDSKKVVSAAETGISVWDTETGKQLSLNSDEESKKAIGVGFAPNGHEFATIHSPWPVDAEVGSDLKIWNLECELQDTFHIPAATYGRGLAYAPSGKHIAVSSADRLLLWNRESRSIETEVPVLGGYNVVFSRDGSLLATDTGVWEYPRLKRRFPQFNFGFAVAIHPDNHTLACGRVGGRLELRSSADGRLLRQLKGHSSLVLSAHFSPDGRRLATGSQSGTVIVWNLESGNEILRYRDHEFWVRGLRFSPDGKTLVSSESGTYYSPRIVFRRSVSEATAVRLLSDERGP